MKGQTKKFMRNLRIASPKKLQRLYKEHQTELILEIGHIKVGMAKNKRNQGRIGYMRKNIARILTVAKERGIEIQQAKKV